jgi:hypothetical protein
MQTNRKLLFALLFVLMGLSLMLGSPREADAIPLTSGAGGQWEEVAGYIDAYVDSQYVAGNSETGFIHAPLAYKGQIDSNGDGTFCGVGDDMANRPVLVDNLVGTGKLIPGTSIRNSWNSGSATIGGMSPAVLSAVRNKVIAHREAGFSDAISIY